MNGISPRAGREPVAPIRYLNTVIKLYLVTAKLVYEFIGGRAKDLHDWPGWYFVFYNEDSVVA